MGYNGTKLKVQLKLAVQRLKMLQQKKLQLTQTQRREVAALLEKGKLESARIRVEHIIREDYNCEALEMLEIYAEMLLVRFGLIEMSKTLDASVAEAACSLAFAANRIEVSELIAIRDQLISKFGPQFKADALENARGIVNERLIHKMKITTPDPKIVNGYLAEIAHNFNVPWGEVPDEFTIDHSLIGSDSFSKGGPSGGSGGASGGDIPSIPPMAMPSYSANPAIGGAPNMSMPMPHMGMPMPHMGAQPGFVPMGNLPPQPQAPIPQFDFPSVPQSSAGAPGGDDDDMPDFDDLQKRFDAIKRR